MSERVFPIPADMQLSLDFEAGITERHRSLLEACAYTAHSSASPLKVIAADLDCSPSDLARKLSGNPDDKRNLSVNDMVKLIESTNDMTPIYWLIEKFHLDDDQRSARAAKELAKALPAILALAKQMGVKA